MILTLSTLGLAVGVGILSRRVRDRRNKLKQIILSSQQLGNTFQDIEKKAKDRLIMGKEKQHDITVALASAPVAWIGLSSMPFTVLSVIMMSYVRSSEFSRGLTSLKEKKVTQDHVNIFAVAACVLSGHVAVAATVAAILPLREYLVEAAEDKAEKKLGDAFLELPKYAWVLYENIEKKVRLSSVELDDIVIVTAGSVIPVDGKVVSGEGLVDNHQFTGEWKLVEVTEGQQVLAGVVLSRGRIHVCVQRTGNETSAAEISQILHSAADKKLSVLTRSEAFSNQRAPLLLTVGLFSMPFLGLYHASALAISGPGGAFRFTAPITVLQTLSYAADLGILIKDGRSLELLKDVDTVVFDKTGTLTKNKLKITQILCAEGISTETVLRFSAAAEQGSEHPIAEAILYAADKQHIDIPRIDDISANFGLGIIATLEGCTISLGSRRFFEQEQVKTTWCFNTLEHDAAERGNSIIFIGKNKETIGAIELAPTLRKNSQFVIDELKKRDIKPIIISGDNTPSTRAIATQLGIETYFAETMPEDKSRIVEDLQAKGHNICFVGDGINDAPALKCANVSISIRGSTTLAMDTAQIVLAVPDLGLIIKAMDITYDFDKNLDTGKMLSNVIPMFGIGSLLLFQTGYLMMSATNFVALGASIYATSRNKSISK